MPVVRALAAALVLTGTLAMAENRIDIVRPDAPALAQPGAEVIGVTTLELVHAAQVDILAATATEAPVADRPLTVELWYPAAEGTVPGGTYATVLRDGVTPVTLHGRAARDAVPAEGRFPLVIVSHGYPGNRFLLSPLAEHLATHGFVVASIDHTESTYSDQAAFGSTLYHRPRDQRFVLDTLAGLEGPLGAIIDADRTAVVGYSMGGYGALVFGGAGLTAASAEFDWGPPGGLLAVHQAGSDSHAALVDPRVRAIVAFGPWGRNADLWDADGLAGVVVPAMIIAGGVDDVSGYGAMRSIFDELTGTTRHLLTFEAANHNAGAPMPAPAESWAMSERLGYAPFDHYADPVWDTVRMNNISAHFVTAFLSLHLRDDASAAPYLDLIPVAADGVLDRAEDGTEGPAHTFWRGFPDRTAMGLRFETRGPGEGP